jgi:putative CocE/NonD family hydrolase
MKKAPALRKISSPRRTARWALCWLLAAALPSWAHAADFEFHAPVSVDDPNAPAIMRDLAQRILPVYQEQDPDRYLANLSALQMALGDYTSAYASRQSLRNRRRAADLGRRVGRAVIFDIYAHAKAMEAEKPQPFAEAFTQAFGDVVPQLNDEDAYAVTRWLATSLPVFQDALQKAFDQRRLSDSISASDAMDLIWTYLGFEAYRTFGALVDTLDAEDDARRYETESGLRLDTADGASISVQIVRPKNPAKPLPTLLEFTIYDAEDYAKECAAHGYVGVVAYTRGTHTNPRDVVPYEHDGDDARAVIEWIARQPWSDGQVGMYGDGYSGFTSWAAAKRPPAALKAIATSAATAPGIDAPMSGSIFHNSAYRWSLYATDPDPSSEAEYYNDALWRALDQKWYQSGWRYRDLSRLNQLQSPIFTRWLNHPSYDGYWRKMIPFRDEFARIDIPVLTLTGYYAGSQAGALYYYQQHLRYNPSADHTLLIGPYDDGVMPHGPLAMLQKYAVDPVALIDPRELRYQWFDHVLKGAAPPPLLKDRVNYEVMGTDAWQHAASLQAMAPKSLRFYLDQNAAGDRHRLVRRKPAHAAIMRQTVSLTDRSDFAWTPPADFISTNLTTHNSLMFVSEPLAAPTEFSGLFSGRLDFSVNKMDVDLNVTLYELLPGGDYIYLFNPTYEFRASYVHDRTRRQLLKAGERQELSFKSERMTSRLLQSGSRLVMVLGVDKRPDREINYGTGEDVSEESIADGTDPIKIRWFSGSYIDIPVRQ